MRLEHRSRTRPARHVLMALASVCVSVACTSAEAATDWQLELTEVRSIRIPLDYQVDGVAFGESEQLLFWSRSSSLILLDSAGHLRALSLQPGTRVLGARFRNARTVELVNGGTKELMQLTIGESQQAVETAIVRDAMLDQGEPTVFHRGEWLQVRREADSSVVLVGLFGSGQARRHVLPEELAPGIAAVPTMSSHGDFMMLASSSPPLTHGVLAGWGAPVVRHVPDSLLPSADSTSVYRPAWRALPVLPLDRGALQTVADTRSDDRVLVVFDADGVPRRVRHLSAPIGIVATSPVSRLAVVARTVSDPEMVLYRWAWSGEERTSTRRTVQ